MGRRNRSEGSTEGLEAAPDSLEAPAAPEADAPAPEAAPTPEAAPAAEAPKDMPAAKPYVSLAVFMKVSGKKPDQMAGFKRWAERKGLGPLPVLEWRAKYDEFMSRPVA